MGEQSRERVNERKRERASERKRKKRERRGKGKKMRKIEREREKKAQHEKCLAFSPVVCIFSIQWSPLKEADSFIRHSLNHELKAQ